MDRRLQGDPHALRAERRSLACLSLLDAIQKNELWLRRRQRWLAGHQRQQENDLGIFNCSQWKHCLDRRTRLDRERRRVRYGPCFWTNASRGGPAAPGPFAEILRPARAGGVPWVGGGI